MSNYPDNFNSHAWKMAYEDNEDDENLNDQDTEELKLRQDQFKTLASELRDFVIDFRECFNTDDIAGINQGAALGAEELESVLFDLTEEL